MSRIIRGASPPARAAHYSDLVAELVTELRSNRESGQPIIDEQHFPESGAIRVYVLWDRWDRLRDAERTEAILEAYEQAEGRDVRDRIAIAVGLTIREAAESGLLPWRVWPSHLPADRSTLEQYRQAMLDEGGGDYLGPDSSPLLGFATMEEAEACVRRLEKRLPSSVSTWVLTGDTSLFEP